MGKKVVVNHFYKLCIDSGFLSIFDDSGFLYFQIVIILRGIPGSGKSYVAKIIKVSDVFSAVCTFFLVLNCFSN